MKTSTRRQLAPLRITTSGSPAKGDLRALAALLVKLDERPPVKLVATAMAGEDPQVAPGELNARDE